MTLQTVSSSIDEGIIFCRLSSKNAVVRESGSSRSGPKGPARGLQGSGQLVCALRVVPGAITATKGLTGFLTPWLVPQTGNGLCDLWLRQNPFGRCSGGGQRACRRLRERLAFSSRDGKPWRASFTRESMGDAWELCCLCNFQHAVVWWNAYELAAANCGIQLGRRRASRYWRHHGVS